MLHIVNKSPFERDVLNQCLKRAQKGSTILLIEDAVYAAASGNTASKALGGRKDDFQLYVLGPDLQARGIAQDQVMEGVTVVGYDGFVDLAAETGTIQSWL